MKKVHKANELKNYKNQKVYFFVNKSSKIYLETFGSSNYRIFFHEVHENNVDKHLLIKCFYLFKFQF